uniref:Uncharacterized protein n=1 Tax=Anguilla anguilla TaxID=7936 RepID=A0A0E9RFJ0_ANGAN
MLMNLGAVGTPVLVLHEQR